MIIVDWKRFRTAYLKAREKFLREYDDVIGVGYGFRGSEPIIVILVRKGLPIDKVSYKQLPPQDFEGFPLVPREPRNNHDDLTMIDWHKVQSIAEAMRTLVET
jgi:hypothetical protein